jgi:predicted DCC family thiol-disulfide oxidoreductase YuxK
LNPETHDILLFDGICNLCNAVVRFIIRRDKKDRFKFAPLQSQSGQALLKKFCLPLDDINSFVLIKGEKYYLRSDAGLMVLKELGGVWKLFYALMIFPRPFRDFVYHMVAVTRYKVFGKKDKCMIPSPEQKESFLE